jgi:hypothetical protein
MVPPRIMATVGPITSASGRDYYVFGLRVRSALELPELFAAEGDAEPDVVIRLGPIDLPPSRPGLAPADDGLLLTIPEVGRFLIVGGRSVRIEAADGIEPRNVRLYLLGSAFGVLLHQRRLLPLHANAVEIGGEAIAFAGASGAGKSTLAAWFHDKGYRVLADDVCVVGFDVAGTAMVYPGIPRLRLWRDALMTTGRSPNDHEPSFSGEASFDKFDVPTTSVPGRAVVPLKAAIILERSEQPAIERLDGIDAVEMIFNHTYRGQMVAQTGDPIGHWQACVKLVRSTAIVRWGRMWGLDQTDSQVDELVSWLFREAPASA